MIIKKIGAILAGTALLSSALAGAVAAADLPPRSFFINEDGTPAVLIVVGEESAASDVVAASLVAAKIGTMAVKIETVELPGRTFAVQHLNIPLMQQVADDPASGLPLVDPNYVYGVTLMDVPDTNAYADSVPKWQPPMIPPIATPYLSPIPHFFATPVYTLASLWYFDDPNGFFGNDNQHFDAWETHEEIQIRFDNLFLFDPMSGGPVQDHLADFVGGDTDPRLHQYNTIGYYMRLEPGLNYRVDNIRRPIQQELCNEYLWHKVTGLEIVDLHQQWHRNIYLPEPYSIITRRLPKIKFFGEEYTVVDATFLWDWNMGKGVQDDLWKLGDADQWAGEYVIITGTPTSYVEEYFYKDETQSFAGYEVTVMDVDVDHNKAWLEIIDPNGDIVFDSWMILDPEHGFSPGLQQMGSTGTPLPQVTVGHSLNDAIAVTEMISYKDENGDTHYQYEFPLFILDGIATFVGAAGTVGVLANLYTLEDYEYFKTQNCCIPFVEEPMAYALWIDQQITIDPRYGNNFPTVDKVADYLLYVLGRPVPYTPNNADLSVIPYGGTWDTIDATGYDVRDDTVTGADGVPTDVPDEYQDNDDIRLHQFLDDPNGDSSRIEHQWNHLEAVPYPYANRDLNDFLWLYESCFTPYTATWDISGWTWIDFNKHYKIKGDFPLDRRYWDDDPTTPNWENYYQNGYPDTDIFYYGGAGGNLLTNPNHVEGEQDQNLPADYMWEMNIKLCDSFEIVKCTTKYIFDGPNHYFKLNVTDITWDDNLNGILGDAVDDGIDFETVMEIPAGTYEKFVSVEIDESALVKLDVEITNQDKQNYNLILIGGPVHNKTVQELIDMGIGPNDGSPVDWMYTSLGDYKLYTNPYGTGKDVLVVAGRDREATRSAAEQLVANL